MNNQGFGGLYGVGKAAIHQPALVVLSHTPEGATETVAWVGKGIVYDTGGLSIKVKIKILLESGTAKHFQIKLYLQVYVVNVLPLNNIYQILGQK